MRRLDTLHVATAPSHNEVIFKTSTSSDAACILLVPIAYCVLYIIYSYSVLLCWALVALEGLPCLLLPFCPIFYDKSAYKLRLLLLLLSSIFFFNKTKIKMKRTRNVKKMR